MEYDSAADGIIAYGQNSTKFSRTKAGGASGAWLFHRVTGVGVFLFLLIHVIDTAFIGWGPELYNKAMSIYRLPFFPRR